VAERGTGRWNDKAGGWMVWPQFPDGVRRKAAEWVLKLFRFRFRERMSIRSPLEGERFVIGETTPLDASLLSLASLWNSKGVSWTSSQDGHLGTGSPIVSLSTGTHVITATKGLFKKSVIPEEAPQVKRRRLEGSARSRGLGPAGDVDDRRRARANSPTSHAGYGEGGQGRPQAARREALTARAMPRAHLNPKPARASWVRLRSYVGQSSSVGVRTQWTVSRSRGLSGTAAPKLGCRSSLRRCEAGMERCGRSQAGSIKRATSPDGGHDTKRARAVAASELSHPASARQRISPSRRP
jgi:hypothetical protein